MLDYFVTITEENFVCTAFRIFWMSKWVELLHNHHIRKQRIRICGAFGATKNVHLSHNHHIRKFRLVSRRLALTPYSKLHAMRASRQLTFMRIGGVIYYDRADIDKMFEKFKATAVK